MPDVARHQNVSLATTAISYDHALSGHHTADDVLPGEAMYIGTDGMLHLAGGTATEGISTRVVYYALATAYENQPVTVATEIRMHYGDGLTPGTRYWLSAVTAGRLATTAPFAGAKAIGLAIDTQRILLTANWQN